MKLEDIKGMIYNLLQTDIGSNHLMCVQVIFGSVSLDEVDDVRFDVRVDQIEDFSLGSISGKSE